MKPIYVIMIMLVIIFVSVSFSVRLLTAETDVPVQIKHVELDVAVIDQVVAESKALRQTIERMIERGEINGN